MAALSAQAQTAPGASGAQPTCAVKRPVRSRHAAWDGLGIPNAARQGDFERARRYLDTTLNSDAAATLANQLFVVLDVRLPVRLPLPQQCARRVSPARNPLTPDQEVVGTISAKGPVNFVLERVDREATGPISPVSSRTLVSIPGLYDEVVAAQARALVPEFLTSTRIGGASRVARRPARFASCVFADGGAATGCSRRQ